MCVFLYHDFILLSVRVTRRSYELCLHALMVSEPRPAVQLKRGIRTHREREGGRERDEDGGCTLPTPNHPIYAGPGKIFERRKIPIQVVAAGDTPQHLCTYTFTEPVHLISFAPA